MYINPKRHLLSNALLISAIIRLGGSGLYALLRLLVRNTGSVLPDMLDSHIHLIQSVISMIQVVLVGYVLFHSYRKVRRMISLIPAEDRDDMGILQAEAFGKNTSSLSADAISRLLQIWMAILVGTQMIYDLSSQIYRNVLTQLIAVISADNNQAMIALYNSTHGFKYLAMFIAIMLGIMMTGIFLNDQFLKIIALLLSLIFVVSFSFLRMTTVNILNTSIGVVWTSVIFHLIETVGIFVLAFYLRFRYKGV